MSGHSKWATIHRQKEVADAKKGLAWTKAANAITVAVRQTGITDPEKNFKLRLAIEKAKSLNMPKENIQKAILRGSGEGSDKGWEEVVYEGFGPAGVAIIIEASTDNPKRTAQEIKNILEKNGGKMGSPGAVSHLFEDAGLITVEKTENPESQVLQIIDLGVEDVEETDDAIEIYTKVDKLEEVKRKLTEAGFKVLSSELVKKPKSFVSISESETAKKILQLMDKIEDQADVSKVFANFDIPQEYV